MLVKVNNVAHGATSMHPRLISPSLCSSSVLERGAFSDEFDFLANHCHSNRGTRQQSPTSHNGVIYDISFDWQKRRLATCSADQTVFIWTLEEVPSSGGSASTSSYKWVRDSTIKEHGGTAWKVTWAHPQFGQILATCSFDNKRARLFEAVPGDNNDLGRKRLVLVNSFEDKLNNLVTDIKFTPPQLGLALGMCSVDGYVRIMGPEGGDLKSWREMVHINIKHSSLSCLAFSESTRDNVLVAVGAEIVSTEESVVALGAQDLSETPKNAAPSQSSYFNLFYIDIKHADRGRSRNMALVSLDDPKLYVDSPVRACCFAPVLGRSFQYLAIGASSMIVYQIKSSKIMARSTLSYPPNFNNPYCAIWRLAWNITGTQLVGSTTHGNVFVWHLNSLMNWQLVRAAVANRNSDVSIERPIGLSEITVDTGGGSHS